MHCPNCGQQTSADLKFCRSCGMKLDSVVRAVNEHFTTEEPAEIEKTTETSERPSGSRFFSRVFIGFILIFIGVVIGVAGQGMWGAKTAAVIISLLGMLISASSFLAAGARYDRELFRSAGREADRASGRTEMRKAEPELELPPRGDDFPPVPSVTEGTTRNLDKNKTKVLR